MYKIVSRVFFCYLLFYVFKSTINEYYNPNHANLNQWFDWFYNFFFVICQIWKWTLKKHLLHYINRFCNKNFLPQGFSLLVSSHITICIKHNLRELVVLWYFHNPHTSTNYVPTYKYRIQNVTAVQCLSFWSLLVILTVISCFWSLASKIYSPTVNQVWIRLHSWYMFDERISLYFVFSIDHTIKME